MEGSETGGGRRMVYTCRKCGLPKKGHQCLALAQDEQGGKHLNDNIAVRGGDGEIHAIKEIKRRSRKKRNEDEEEEEEDARNNEEGLEDEGVNERGAHGFKHFVVLDLEATCDEDYNRNFFPQEIIEFSAVIVDAQALCVGDSLQLYVKPVVHPRLTPFCINLTGITQDQVDCGVSLAKALGQFEEWLIRNSLLDHSGPSPQARFCFATWTDWDLETMLEGQCGRIGLHKPDYFNSWIDLKASFLRRYKNSGRWKLDAAVRSLGLEWTGRAHSGLDDCINTANLLLRLLRDEGLVSPRKM